MKALKASAFLPSFSGLLLRVAFSVLAFIPFGCSKSAKDTTIVGKVLTYGTDEIIDHPPVKVQLYREDLTSCWGCGTNYTVIDFIKDYYNKLVSYCGLGGKNKIRCPKGTYYVCDWGSLTDVENIYHFLYKDAIIFIKRKKETFDKIVSITKNRKKYRK